MTLAAYIGSGLFVFLSCGMFGRGFVTGFLSAIIWTLL